MPFAVGDTVIHRYHGPGRIARIDQVQGRSGTHDCYVVDFGHRLVVWVPIDGTSELSLRAPLTAHAIDGLAQILRSPAGSLKPMSRDRQLQIKLLMLDGSPDALCTLVRDLTAYAARKVPNASDSAALEKVRAILVAEWGLATHSEDAAAEVNALLREGALLTNQIAVKQMAASQAALSQSAAT